MGGTTAIGNGVKNFVNGVLHQGGSIVQATVIQPPAGRSHITRVVALAQSDAFRNTNLYIVPEVAGRASSIDTAAAIARTTLRSACPVVNASWLTESAVPHVINRLVGRKLRHIIFSNGASTAAQEAGFLSVLAAVRSAKGALSTGDAVKIGCPIEIPSYKQRTFHFEQVKRCIEEGLDFALIRQFFDPEESVKYLLSLKKESGRLPALLPMVSAVESFKQWKEIVELSQNLGDRYVDEMNEAGLFKTDFAEHAREVMVKNLREFLRLAEKAELPVAGTVVDPSLSGNLSQVVEQFQQLDL